MGGWQQETACEDGADDGKIDSGGDRWGWHGHARWGGVTAPKVQIELQAALPKVARVRRLATFLPRRRSGPVKSPSGIDRANGRSCCFKKKGTISYWILTLLTEFCQFGRILPNLNGYGSFQFSSYCKVENDSNTLQGIRIYSANIRAILLKFQISKV